MLGLCTPPEGTDGFKEAREGLLALGRQSAEESAALRENLSRSSRSMDDFTRRMRGLDEQHADLVARLRDALPEPPGLEDFRRGINLDILGSPPGVDDYSHRMGEIGQAAAAAIATQGLAAMVTQGDAADTLRRTLEILRGDLLAETLFPRMADHSKILDDALLRNHAISSQIDDSIARVAADLPDIAFDNPIHETNQKLDRMITMQVQLAEFNQSLNETTIAFLSEFRGVVQKTSRQTCIFMVVALLTLIVTGVGTWLNFKGSNDTIDTNQQMLENLADRIAILQSNMASQSADEREAMLAEQRSLIEHLISTTQALIEQQGSEQRAAIKELRRALTEVAKQVSSAAQEP